MPWRVLDQRIPWILLANVAEGGAYVADQRTGETQFCPDEDCVYGFAADRSGGPHAIGNLVHRALAAAGFRRCGACAQRQIGMNQSAVGRFLSRLFG
jgi:hypothetical protein